MKEAMANLYTLLRETEIIEGAKFVIISNLDELSESCEDHNSLPDFLETVYDKTFRASSGRLLTYCLKSNKC